MTVARRLVLLALVAVAFVSAFGAWDFYMKQKGHIDDADFYFLYGTTGAIVSPARYRELSTRFIAAERQQGYPEVLAKNLELKRDYAFNYVLASSVYYAAAVLPSHLRREAQKKSLDAPLDPEVLRFGFLATFMLAFSAVCWLVWRVNDLGIAAAFAFTVVVCAHWSTTWQEAGDQRFVYIWLNYPAAELRRNLLNFFVNPRWYSFLHNSPRSTFVVILLGVFVLRWSGRTAESYWCLLVAILTHGSNGLLMTACLVGIDAVSNPLFYGVRTLLPAACAIVLAVATESVWPSILFRGGMRTRTAAVLLTSAAGAWLLWRMRRRSARGEGTPTSSRILRALARVDAPGRASVDVLMLAVLWIALFATSVALTRHLTGYQEVYFFEQANGRLLAILQPVLIMGACLAVLRLAGRIHPVSGRWAVAVSAVTALALLPPTVSALKCGLAVPDRLIPDLMRRVPEFEAQVETPPLQNRNREMSADDLTLYVDYRFFYALARSLDSGIDYVSPLVGMKPLWTTGLR